ncbi:hypothetical protein TNCV_3012531 [Trichonephila clavipes]|nr:hypothetical protein TNCV_3012531 [Trichonephila clavipes]
MDCMSSAEFLPFSTPLHFHFKFFGFECPFSLLHSSISLIYIVPLMLVVVEVSFPKERNKCCQSMKQVAILYDRWRYHLSPPPQFRYGTVREGIILQSPATMVSAATTHKFFEPLDLMSTYSVCTRKVFGGIGHQTQVFRSGVRCSNH